MISQLITIKNKRIEEVEYKKPALKKIDLNPLKNFVVQKSCQRYTPFFCKNWESIKIWFKWYNDFVYDGFNRKRGINKPKTTK